MLFDKPALTVEKQIELLKLRGLQFKDETKAIQTLHYIGYYRLRAYTYPFQENNTEFLGIEHSFKSKMYFEDIIKLYKFDRHLRLLIFNAIEKIEISLRAQILYHFGLEHGSHWQMDISLYKDPNNYMALMENFYRNSKQSKEDFMIKYKKTYTNPSLPASWMLLEVMSLGSLSKIYKELNYSKAKQQVSLSFGLPKVEVLESWVECFTYVRNICAHHNRLWNRNLAKPPKLPYNTIYDFLTKDKSKAISHKEKVKIYWVLYSMNYLLKQIDIEGDFNFSQQLKSIMASCPLNQQKHMGFQENWLFEPFWQ